MTNNFHPRAKSLERGALNDEDERFRRGAEVLARVRMAKAIEKNRRRQRLKESFHQQLKELERIWMDVQSSRSRDAIYPYLRRVYRLVLGWQVRRKVKAFVARTQHFVGEKLDRNAEPFAVMIAATANVDAKTVSKWSRALRFVRRFKRRGVPFKQFVKAHDGINGCATGFAARLGRRRSATC